MVGPSRTGNLRDILVLVGQQLRVLSLTHTNTHQHTHTHTHTRIRLPSPARVSACPRRTLTVWASTEISVTLSFLSFPTMASSWWDQNAVFVMLVVRTVLGMPVVTFEVMGETQAGTPPQQLHMYY